MDNQTQVGVKKHGLSLNLLDISTTSLGYVLGTTMRLSVKQKHQDAVFVQPGNLTDSTKS